MKLLVLIILFGTGVAYVSHVRMEQEEIVASLKAKRPAIGMDTSELDRAIGKELAVKTSKTAKGTEEVRAYQSGMVVTLENRKVVKIETAALTIPEGAEKLETGRGQATVAATPVASKPRQTGEGSGNWVYSKQSQGGYELWELPKGVSYRQAIGGGGNPPPRKTGSAAVREQMGLKGSALDQPAKR